MCDVCNGLGTYPIFSGRGGHLYDIVCPECSGFPDAAAPEHDLEYEATLGAVADLMADPSPHSESVSKTEGA